MKWSNHAWTKAENIYDQIIQMPFIRGLIDGTLEREKFQFYILQDAKYLEDFARALSMIAARAHLNKDMLDFIRFAEGAIIVESALHANYLNGLERISQHEISPTCHHYNNFLTSTAATAQVEVAMGAVLPCFWVYKKVGDYILMHQNKNANPYQDWINTYSGKDFDGLVKKAIAICDEAADNCSSGQREKMTQSFVTGCQLEWMFWDSAWRLEKWPFNSLQ